MRCSAFSGKPVEQALVVLEEQCAQRLLEHEHVGDGQIHALGAGRRDGVRGIPDQGDAALQQLVRDEAPEPQHVALEDRALLQRRAGHPLLQLVPQLASLNEFGSTSGSHWKYMRCTVALRWLMSAKPSGELL